MATCRYFRWFEGYNQLTSKTKPHSQQKHANNLIVRLAKSTGNTSLFNKLERKHMASSGGGWSSLPGNSGVACASSASVVVCTAYEVWHSEN